MPGACKMSEWLTLYSRAKSQDCSKMHIPKYSLVCKMTVGHLALLFLSVFWFSMFLILYFKLFPYMVHYLSMLQAQR